MHELPAGGEEAIEASLWQLSESHWGLPGAMLVETGVSPSYLLSYLRQALAREGIEGRLLVTSFAGQVHTTGLDTGILAWIQASQSALAE
ncbi:hypothetical protein [Roseomonas sp. WA12]